MPQSQPATWAVTLEQVTLYSGPSDQAVAFGDMLQYQFVAFDRQLMRCAVDPILPTCASRDSFRFVLNVSRIFGSLHQHGKGSCRQVDAKVNPFR